LANIAFQLKNNTNTQFTAMQIYNNGINANVPINLTTTNGITLNGGSVVNMGSSSTAYTQPNGTGNTSVATTAFVQNMFTYQTVTVTSPNTYYTVNSPFNAFQSYISDTRQLTIYCNY
jgi:hypothetical protein